MYIPARSSPSEPIPRSSITVEDMSQLVEGVVLAAGLSSRSKQYKLALPLGGSTVIEKGIEGMYDVVRRVVVVVGWREEQIRSLLAAYHKVELVTNQNFREGMFSSVKVGIALVVAPRFFLLPGDHPFVQADVYTKLLDAEGDIVIPTFGGRRGHPVLFRSHLIPQVLDSPDSANLRDFIRTKGHTEVPVDQDSILIDIDTLEDYHAALAKRQQ